tara:strand:+ start:2592 stop:2876 length:285 start_codon:yes stop_codon:yes gene_type:complete
MPISRFINKNGEEYNISSDIFKAVESGIINYKEVVVEDGKRLDHYSFEEYNDGLNWWIIAAASGIGWWLQVTGGTVIRIPTDLSQIEELKDSLL